MGSIETFFMIFLGVQFFHSIEELTQGFHKKFPLFKMSFRFFLTFEIIFFLFWLSVVLLKEFPFREYLMPIFIVLMFANGLWHLVWFGIVKKYVPGVLTAPLFVILFLVFYFSILF